MERAPTASVPGYPGSKKYKDVRVYQLAEFPVRGLVFECGQNLPDMADFVAEVCVRLQKANIPHNLFIVDCGLRLFLYPNGFAQAKAEVGLWVFCLRNVQHFAEVSCVWAQVSCVYFKHSLVPCSGSAWLALGCANPV